MKAPTARYSQQRNFRAAMGASGSKSDPTKAEIDASAIADALAALNMGALDASAAERACRRVGAMCLESDNPQQRLAPNAAAAL